VSPLVFSRRHHHLPCPYPQPCPLFLAFRLAFSPTDGRIERNLHYVGPIFSIPPFQMLPMKRSTRGTQRTNRHVDEPHHGRAIRCRRRQPRLTRQAILEANWANLVTEGGSSAIPLQEPFVDDWMIGCRPVHHATSRICYTASLEPLDEGAQSVFEPLHTGYPVVPLGNCTWEKGTRFVSFTFCQSIPPCLGTNSLLCLHRLMVFLFIQVRVYLTLRRATRRRVVNRGRGKRFSPPFPFVFPLVVSSEVDASCVGSLLPIHIRSSSFPLVIPPLTFFSCPSAVT
jgi:hypothetical protein